MKILLASICACLGTFIIWWGVQNLRRLIHFRAFPKTTATMTSRNVISGSGEGGTSYWPQAEFNYSVNGVAYSSTLLWSLGNFGGFGYSAPKAHKILDTLHQDGLSVHYDPENPSFAFVFNGPLPQIFMPAITGILLIVYAVCIFSKA